MKKYIVLFSVMMTLKASAQTATVIKKDTIFRTMELPPTMISIHRQKLRDENFNLKLQGAALKRQTGAQDLPYALGSMAGVVVSSDAGTGTGYTDIKVRGTDLTRINVTLNGVPVNDPESQATYFVNTPDLLSSSNSIELQKGVGNSKNGSSNFGASLSIQNLDFSAQKAGASYSFDFGTFNTFRHSLKLHTGLVDDRFQAIIRLSSIASDGYIDRSASNLKAAQVAARYIFNPKTKITFNYLKGKEKTGQAWNGVQQDSLATNRTYNELGLKSDGSFYNNQTDNYGQDYYQLFIDHVASKHWILGSTLFYTRGLGYYEEYKTAQPFGDYGLSDPIIGQDTLRTTDLIRQLWLDNHFFGGRFSANYFKNKLEAGLFINYNQYQGKHYGRIIWSEFPTPQGYTWYNLKADKQDLNAYGMIEYRMNNRWKLFADLQVRQVQYNLYGFRRNPQIEHQLDYLFFSPKGKIRFTQKNHQLILSSGFTQKEPNRDDIEAGAKDLPKPEKLWDVELQYIFSSKDKWGFYATLYNMQYQDQLVLTGRINDVGAYTRSNIDRSYRRGIELEAAYRDNKWFELKANVSLSSNKILDFTEYIDNYDQGGQIQKNYKKTTISFSPSVVAGGLLSFFPLHHHTKSIFNKWSIDVLPKYVGKQYLDNTQNESRSIKAYGLADLLLQCPLTIQKNKTLILKTGIFNVLNTMYEARGYTFSYVYGGQSNTFNYYYPQAGRRFLLGLQLSW